VLIGTASGANCVWGDFAVSTYAAEGKSSGATYPGDDADAAGDV
jgi:hypothetical protein